MARSITVSGSDAKAAESTGFKPWPAGNYIGTIIDVKETTIGKVGSKSPNAKKPALNVTVKFTDSNTGKGEGKKFIAWRVPDFTKWASGEGAFLFYQFYKALGVVFPPDGEDGDVDVPDLEELLDQEIGIALKIEKDDKGVSRNAVAGFFAASKGVGEPVATADDDADLADEFTL